MSDRKQWAEEHGYYHWHCWKCGRTGWTDTQPDCDCEEEKVYEEHVKLDPGAISTRCTKCGLNNSYWQKLKCLERKSADGGK